MKKIIYTALVIIIFASCQQTEKIGYVDNSILINKYQEKIDIEEKLKVKIASFQNRNQTTLIHCFRMDTS